jgi:hypothetical protein
MATKATTAIAGETLKEFELTWVVYDPKDPFGALLALCTLSPVYVLARRDCCEELRPSDKWGLLATGSSWSCSRRLWSFSAIWTA